MEIPMLERKPSTKPAVFKRDPEPKSRTCWNLIVTIHKATERERGGYTERYSTWADFPNEMRGLTQHTAYVADLRKQAALGVVWATCAGGNHIHWFSVSYFQIHIHLCLSSSGTSYKHTVSHTTLKANTSWESLDPFMLNRGLFLVQQLPCC